MECQAPTYDMTEQELAEKAARKAARRALRAQQVAEAGAQCADPQDSEAASPLSPLSPASGRGRKRLPAEAAEPSPADPPAEDEDERAAAKRARRERRAREQQVEEAEATESPAEASPPAAAEEEDPASPLGGHGASPAAQKFCAEFNITVSGTGSEAFEPILTFAAAGFPARVQPVLQGYDKPTPIQSATWPLILQKRDVIGVAETGSGKTLAFALPSLQHTETAELSKGLFPILVMAPTRELAVQIHTVYASLNCRVTCLYGGVPKPPQISQLRRGVSVVIATPGRLLDLVQSEECDLRGVDFVVLDEADRMLDIGFEQDIRTIMAGIAPKRQTLFFTATWPTSIRKLASEFLNDPLKVVIGSPKIAANKRVNQIVELLDDRQKDQRLLQVLQQYGTGKNRIIIFVLYKKDAPRIEDMLARKGWHVAAIHGDAKQATRSSVLENFKRGKVPLLVATDVAARGLDVDDIEYVINYSMPLTIEDYVHRIGRTARAGKTGVAHTFFSHYADRNLGWDLARVLREAGQDVPAPLEKYTPCAKKLAKLAAAEEPIDVSKKVHHKFDSDED